MDVVGLAASLAVAAVFVVSGVAKLLDRAGTREAVAGFGVPQPYAAPVSIGLAPAELAIAVLVIVEPTRVAGLLLAALLLLGFTVAVLVVLRSGRRPECHCFGRIGASDISARTVLRNLVLLMLTALGLAGAADAASTGPAGTVAAAILGTALAAAVVAGEGMAGSRSRRRRDAQADSAYAEVRHVPAPRFALDTVHGASTGLDELLEPGRPVLLVSLSPGCDPCRALRPDVALWSRFLAPRLTVAVLASGSREHNAMAYHDLPWLPVLLDDGDVRASLGTTAAPSAVVIDPDGFICSGVATGDARVRRLMVSTITGTDPGDAASQAFAPEFDDVGLDAVVGPRAAVASYEMDGSTVLIDTSTGATVVLDAVGGVVWSVLDGASSLAEIVNDLAEVFGAPVDTVGPDVVALARTLGAAGLLELVAPTTGGRAESAASAPH